MTIPPRSALMLGLAGLVPFVWSAATQLSEGAAVWTMQVIGPRFVGPYLGLSYGTIILAFMSGVLWGFATRAEGRQAAAGYALSVIPALWAFFFVGGGVTSASIYLIAGFVGLVMIDAAFLRQGLAPAWWLRLRVPLTAVVALCLAVPLLR
jgi:Protein of unknown function (DUF3429)